MSRHSFRLAALAAALLLFALPLRADDTAGDLVGRVRLSGKDPTDVAIVTSSGTYDLHWRSFFNTYVREVLFGQDGKTVKLHVQIEEPAEPGKPGRAYADGIYGRAKYAVDVVTDETEGEKTVQRVADHLKKGEVVILEYRFFQNLVKTDRGVEGWVKRYALDFGGFSDRPPAKPAKPTAGLVDGLGR
jgi:hypothetical protein